MLLAVAGCDKPVQRVEFDEGAASFVPPPGFTPLTATEFTSQVPSGFPLDIVADPTNRSTQIAYGIHPRSMGAGVMSEDMAEVAKELASLMPFRPRWIAHKLVRIGDDEWMYFEDYIPGDNGQLHIITLLKPHGDRTLMFTITVEEGKFAQAEMALRRSMNSVRVASRR
jgi:hypothetical protein